MLMTEHLVTQQRLTHIHQKVLNRIDLKITIWACIAFFGLDLGRGNISQANSARESRSFHITAGSKHV